MSAPIFGYSHLPADGLGHRDPRRPHVTAGIGAGVPVFITTLGGIRTYDRLLRGGAVPEREALISLRTFVTTARAGTGDRMYVINARADAEAVRTLAAIDRAMEGLARSGETSRSYVNVERS